MQSSIEPIHVEPGWTYEVEKWGGLNSTIEVLFLSNTGCEVKFKVLHVPGKTEIDAGTPKC